MKILATICAIVVIAISATMAADINPEQDAAMLVAKGDKEMAMARPTLAVTFYTRAANEYPTTKAIRSIYLKLAHAFSQSGQDDKAVEFAERAVEQKGIQASWAECFLGNHYISKGNVACGVSHLKKVREYLPNDNDLGPINEAYTILGRTVVEKYNNDTGPLSKLGLINNDADKAQVFAAEAYYRGVVQGMFGMGEECVKQIKAQCPSQKTELLWAETELAISKMRLDIEKGTATVPDCLNNVECIGKYVVGKLDMNGTLAPANHKLVEVTASPIDVGSVHDLFDGKDQTLARTKAVNPGVFTFRFENPQKLRVFKILFSNAESTESSDPYTWRLESANSLKDIYSQSGSWIQLIPDRSSPSNQMQSVVIEETKEAKVFILTVKRNTGDAYVHVNEIGMLVDVDPSQIKPSDAAVQLDKIVSDPNLKGYQAAQGSLTLGKYYLKIGKLSDAIRVLQNNNGYLETPCATEILYNLGRAQYKACKFDEGKKILGQLVEKYPTSSIASSAKYYIEACSSKATKPKDIVALIKDAEKSYDARWNGLAFAPPVDVKDDPVLLAMTLISYVADNKPEHAVEYILPALSKTLAASPEQIELAKGEIGIYALTAAKNRFVYSQDAATILTRVFRGYFDKSTIKEQDFTPLYVRTFAVVDQIVQSKTPTKQKLESLDWLADFSLTHGNYTDALVYYRKYVSLTNAPDRLSYGYYYMGICYRKLGQKEMALQQFKYVVDNFPDSKRAPYARHELRAN